jgi:hypothetical protein
MLLSSFTQTPPRSFTEMGDNFLLEFSVAMRSKGPSCQLTHLLLQNLRLGIKGAAALGTFMTTNALLQVPLFCAVSFCV